MDTESAKNGTKIGSKMKIYYLFKWASEMQLQQITPSATHRVSPVYLHTTQSAMGVLR